MSDEMTPRDWFAAAAIEGCAEKQFSDALLERLGGTAETARAIALAGYEVADAMMRHREGKDNDAVPELAASVTKARPGEEAWHCRMWGVYDRDATEDTPPVALFDEKYKALRLVEAARDDEDYEGAEFIVLETRAFGFYRNET